MQLISSRNSQWMKAILLIAGLYSILWGTSVILFPNFWFHLANLETPNYIQLWQSYGMYSVSMGIGYLIAYTNPLRHWPIVLVGLTVKILAPIGFFINYLQGDLPFVIFQMNITNDLIWCIPFGLILYNVYVHDYLLDKEIIKHTEHNTKELLSWHHTFQEKDSLLELSEKQPIMLVFLRHFGCTFCREMLSEISDNKQFIEEKGVKIIFVHQLSDAEAHQYFQKFKLSDLSSVSDPELMLYKGFYLERGRLSQIFGWKDIKNLLFRTNIFKLGISSFKDEDPFQMPGVFIVKDGEVIQKFIHTSVSDQVPFKELTSEITTVSSI
ncbi:MAG TPA: AhpC/TSA family protein [Chitinophagales bacterium]|nr:AhpC/TSA family protein [Chitinophagales bacterium]